MKNKTWIEWQEKYLPELTINGIYTYRHKKKELEQTMKKNRRLCGLPSKWSHSKLQADINKLLRENSVFKLLKF